MGIYELQFKGKTNILVIVDRRTQKHREPDWLSTPALKPHIKT